MESFFSSLKTEMFHRTKFQTRREAKAALFEYIEIFYNRQRRHSSIGVPHSGTGKDGHDAQNGGLI